MEEKKVIKLPKKNTQASPTDNSMGGASVASNPNMNMPAPDPNMNMGGDPNMDMNAGADPMMGGDPSMDMNAGADPGMDMGMGGEPNADRQKKEIQKNIGKACDDFRNYQGQDKEELTKWVEGMLDSILDDSDSAGISDEEGGEPMPDDMGGEPTPQVESVIFTKGQLNKINEMIGVGNEEDKDEQPNNEKKQKVKNNNTPFDNPKLNK